MESHEFVWLSIVMLPIAYILLKMKCKQGSKRQPPGPRGLPILGNIFDLGTTPHQNLHKLRPKYGPVLWLKLGSMNTMVIQSTKAAAELFKNHDLSFCDRKCPVTLIAHNYNQGSMAMAPYGSYWRMLRRLFSVELMTSKRINETAAVRQKCVDDMIKHIEDGSATGKSGEVNLAHALFLMSFSLIGNIVLSRDLLSLSSEQGLEFYDALSKVAEWAGKPNLADFLPVLRFLDPQGIMRNMKHDMGRTLKIISGFVNERIQENNLGRGKPAKDFLDILLEFAEVGKEGPQKISNHNVNIFVMEMFFGGTDTTSSTIEWAMAELLRNPESMRNVKQELNRVVGPNKKVEESDIDRLPYLQAVIKETLRLHPVFPLLLPRNTLQDTDFMGYLITKGTQVLVNAWAIGRDPDSWEEPLSFKPERFLGSNIDYKGQNFELIPFGSGRRICVGIPLAHCVIHLAVATLLHSFDWKPANNTALDMNEKMGMSVRKLVPLTAIPTKISCIN